MNMGIVFYNIILLVIFIVVQCLVCCLYDCKKLIELLLEILLVVGFIQKDIDEGLIIFEVVGCDGCNEGYKGCVGIYQVMLMLEEIQKIVFKGGNVLQIVEVVKEVGIDDLCVLVLKKVK